jgi:hypothetical protein
MVAWAVAANSSQPAGEDAIALVLDPKWRGPAARALGTTVVLCDPGTPNAFYRGLAKIVALGNTGGNDSLILADLTWFKEPLPLRTKGAFFERSLGRRTELSRSSELQKPLRTISVAVFHKILRHADAELQAMPNGLAEASSPFDLSQPAIARTFAETIEAVLAAYDHRCAFTGAHLEFLLKDEKDVPCVMIIPSARNGQVEPRNLIAAAPGPQAAFRDGSLAVDGNGGFLVALERIDPLLPNTLNRSRRLAIPKDPAFAPDPRKLRLHRKRIFADR